MYIGVSGQKVKDDDFLALFYFLTDFVHFSLITVTQKSGRLTDTLKNAKTSNLLSANEIVFMLLKLLNVSIEFSQAKLL